MTWRALFFLCGTAPLLAAMATSANYTLDSGTLDSGGLKGIAANYAIDFSMAAGGAGDSPNDRLRTGFAGLLRDAVALEIDRSASTWSINERAVRQLEANLLFDDGTIEQLIASEVVWSVAGGPIAGVDASGNATAASVYQNTPAVVGAAYAGQSGTRTFQILNVGDDDFGAYAGDGLSDLWQVGYFGENNAQAGPGADADADGLINLQEFAFGTNPVISNSGPVAWSGGVLQQRGLPLPHVETSGDAFGFRAVFSRRKDREAAGLAYSVEFSSDLAAWQTSTATPAILAQDNEMEVVSVPYPFFLNGKKARFFRVRVGSL